MRRVGLGRHGSAADDAGDPLEGIVNLFDVGIVLAIAALVAAAGALGPTALQRENRPAGSTPGRTVADPATATPAQGRGRAVGTVYRLDDGRLVYVERPRPSP
ncbi:MAG: DUF2149 domain-containing protein [Solirubrobacteraceae bacterium]